MAGWGTAGSGVAVAHDEDPWQEQVPWEGAVLGERDGVAHRGDGQVAEVQIL
jgi:hypothetical protein